MAPETDETPEITIQEGKAQPDNRNRKRLPMTMEEFLGELARAEDIRRCTEFYKSLQEWLDDQLSAPKALRNELRHFALDYKVEGDIQTRSSHDGLKLISRNAENPHALLIKDDGIYFEGDISKQDPLMIAKNMVLMAYTKGDLSNGPVDLSGSAKMKFYMLKMIEHINAELPEKQKIQVNGANKIKSSSPSTNAELKWNKFIKTNGLQPEKTEFLKESPDKPALETYLLNEETKKLLSHEKTQVVRDNLVKAAQWIIENQNVTLKKLQKALKVTNTEAKLTRLLLKKAGLYREDETNKGPIPKYKILIDKNLHPVEFGNYKTVFLAAALNKVDLSEKYPEFTPEDRNDPEAFNKGTWEMINTFSEKAFGEREKAKETPKDTKKADPGAGTKSGQPSGAVSLEMNS